MNKKNKATLSSTEQAIKMYTDIINKNKMSQLRIVNWPNSVTLVDLVHSEGWLATWMLRSDELAIALYGARVWDVFYMASEGAVEGVEPVDFCNAKKDDAELHSYSAYPCISKGEKRISDGMIFLICQGAFLNSLEINNNKVAIKPINGFYPTKKALGHGDVLPLPIEELVLAQHLSEFNLVASKKINLIKENQQVALKL